MPAGQVPKKNRRKPSATPLSLSPTDRLNSLTRERIDTLERDKLMLRTEVERLRLLVDRLGPENARLEESLSNAEFNNVLATILIGGGGFLVSYATFTGKAASTWANIAAGCLISGIVLLFGQSVRRWRRG